MAIDFELIILGCLIGYESTTIDGNASCKLETKVKLFFDKIINLVMSIMSSMEQLLMISSGCIHLSCLQSNLVTFIHSIGIPPVTF